MINSKGRQAKTWQQSAGVGAGKHTPVAVRLLQSTTIDHPRRPTGLKRTQQEGQLPNEVRSGEIRQLTTTCFDNNMF